MFRLRTTQLLNTKSHCSEGQKGIARQKRPHLITLIIIQLTLLALIGGLFVPATPTYARSSSHDSSLWSDDPGAYSVGIGKIGADAGFGYFAPYQQVTTTLDVDILSTPWATVDSNGEPGPVAGGIPEAFVVEAAVTNTGDVTATNVVVTLDYNPSGDWVLLTGEDPVRMIEALDPGETFYAYWFASYPQDNSGVGHQYTVTASAANADPVATSQNSYQPNPGWTVRTRNTISSGNSRVTQTSADIVVGVELTIVQETNLGTNPGDITFSPVGNDDFDPSAFRLLTAQVRFFNQGNTQQEIFTDRLYFPESDVPDFGSNVKIWAEVTYTFLPILPENTTLCPYAAIDFTPNAKYDENFCSDSVDTPTKIPITGTLTFSLTKQVSSQTVEQGQFLTYTIDYANNGDEPLLYVWVWDDVPAGVSIDSASISRPSDPDETTGSRVAWNLGEIPAASTGVLTFDVLVDGNGQDLADGTLLVNDAFFGISPGGLPVRAALTSTVTTEVQAPTITITKNDRQDIAGPGDLLTYRVRVRNTGTTPATGLVISDVLPSEVTLTGTVTPNPDSNDGQTLVWNDVEIPSGGSFLAMVPVTVVSDVADGTVIENTATVSYRNTVGHTYAEKTATDTTTAHVPVLAFTKTAEDVDGSPLVVGDTILYTLQVSNTGTYTAQNVVVTDVLPDGVTYVNASADKGTVEQNNGTVNWTIPELVAQNDNVATLLITVTLDDGTEGQTILNTGSVTGDNVPNPPDDPAPVCPDGSQPDPTSGECSTTPTPRDTELAFTKTAQDLNGPPTGVGDAILYTLQVTNIGTYTAYGVTVTDDLPDLVTCQAISGDSAPTGCADQLMWTIPSLARDATATLYIIVTIDQGAEGQTIVNTGSVSGINVPNPPDDPTPVCPDGSTPVDGVCSSTPVPSTSLTLTKSAEDVDGPPVLVGDTIRYTLQVENTGAYTAYNLTVTDNLPDQVTCQDVSGDSPPASCADPLVWSIPSLAPGVTATLYIDVTIKRGTEGQSIINTASVTGGNVPNPPDDPTPVCPDGNVPVDGICGVSPEPAPGGAVFLPIIVKNFKQ